MAVYTEVSDEALAAFLAQYDLGAPLSCKGIAEGVENSNYLLQTETGRFILTLYEKRVAARDLPFFLGLMDHLAARAVPCPTPIAARDGATLKSLCGRPAAIISFLDGMWVRRPEPAHCAALGEALARFHLVAQDFSLRRANALAVPELEPLLASCRPRADEVAAGLAEELDVELASLIAQWPRDLPAGVIHADLFPDNVFFLRGQLSGLIDFYFACNDFFAYDLAICLNAWCFESDGAFNVTKARMMLSRYRAVRPLSRAELDALPILARGAAMRFLLTRLYDWLHRVDGALVKPHDPREYLRKLRFHGGVVSAAAYGLD